MVDRIRSGVYKGEPHDTYVFVFTDNCVLNSVFYKVTSKSTLLFKTVLHIHVIQMEGISILHVVHISGTRMIEMGIDSLSIENNLGGIMRGIYHLKCIPLHLGDLERPK